jgi:CheY-like chemotaxis protein/HPt (histidine-containing phosphotransfer) domain-containing protein
VRRDVLRQTLAGAIGRADLTPARTVAPPAPAAVIAPSVEAARQAGRLILVAEDNPTNQRVVLMQLARLGHAAEVKPDGVAALEAYRQGGHALLLTDCHMPEMDGLELSRAIRAVERSDDRPPLPIVAMTANALAGEAERCLEAGMDDFLTKPVDLQQLAQILERWLAKRGSDSRQAEPPAPQAAAASNDAAPVLDLERLRASVGEIDARAASMLELFVSSTEPMIEALRTAIAERNSAVLLKTAHSVKGAAITAGALELGQVCTNVERATRANDWPAIMAEGLLLLAAFTRLATEVSRLAASTAEYGEDEDGEEIGIGTST